MGKCGTCSTCKLVRHVEAAQFLGLSSMRGRCLNWFITILGCFFEALLMSCLDDDNAHFKLSVEPVFGA